jgi:hypothetical protein
MSNSKSASRDRFKPSVRFKGDAARGRPGGSIHVGPVRQQLVRRGVWVGRDGSATRGPFGLPTEVSS